MNSSNKSNSMSSSANFSSSSSANFSSSSSLRQNEHIHKIILIGDSGVGKTSILTRYAEDTFTGKFISSIGCDFRIMRVNIDGNTIKQQIWDTSGQERFKSLSRNFYKNAKGVIFVYDITNADSFNSIPNWIEELNKYAEEPTAIQKILIGAKLDLNSNRVISYDVAYSMASSYNMEYAEVSAKVTRDDIAEAFTALSVNVCKQEAMLSLNNQNQNNGIQNLNPNQNQPNKKGCC